MFFSVAVPARVLLFSHSRWGGVAHIIICVPKLRRELSPSGLAGLLQRWHPSKATCLQAQDS